MSTLRKIEEISSQKETYTVTVESSIDMLNFKNAYLTMSPETDVIVQLLIYAHDNNWRINEYDTVAELTRQLENYLTEDEVLEIASMSTVNANIDELANELNSIAPKGIEFITIERNGEKYELDVTDEDIRKIFLDMIQNRKDQSKI